MQVRSSDLKEFKDGRTVTSIIKNENAHKSYDTMLMTTLLDEEGKDIYDAKPSLLGHLQQGGSPSPLDRIFATQLAVEGVNFLLGSVGNPNPFQAFLGIKGHKVVPHNLRGFPATMDRKFERPVQQWWLDFKDIVLKMSNKPQ